MSSFCGDINRAHYKGGGERIKNGSAVGNSCSRSAASKGRRGWKNSDRINPFFFSPLPTHLLWLTWKILTDKRKKRFCKFGESAISRWRCVPVSHFHSGKSSECNDLSRSVEWFDNLSSWGFSKSLLPIATSEPRKIGLMEKKTPQSNRMFTWLESFTSEILCLRVMSRGNGRRVINRRRYRIDLRSLFCCVFFSRSKGKRCPSARHNYRLKSCQELYLHGAGSFFFLVRRLRFQPRLCWPTLPARQESKQEPKASLLEREGQKGRRGGLFIRRTNDKRTVAARRSLDGQVVAKLGPTSSSVFQAVADASTMCANNFWHK